MESQGIRVPLVMLEDGSFRRMRRTADGRWAWGQHIWAPDRVSTAQAWDSKTGELMKWDIPE